ncbi:MAG: DUF3313 family protein [Alphaproteobacteria bacterium]
MAQFGDTTLRHLTMGLAVAGGLAIAGHAARAEEAVAAKETAGEAEAEAAQISRPLPKGFTHVSEEMREGLEPVEKADFDILQVRPGTDFSTYRRVYLEPLAYDLFDPRIQEGVTEQDRSFLERTLVRQYERRMGGVVDVVDTIEEGTLVLNLTVTDVRPNRDILGSFPLQRGGRAINQQSVGIGGIAIEGVFSDGETGAIVAATKDRYEGFPLQANPNLFTRYGDARDGMRIYFRKVADLLK